MNNIQICTKGCLFFMEICFKLQVTFSKLACRPWITYFVVPLLNSGCSSECENKQNHLVCVVCRHCGMRCCAAMVQHAPALTSPLHRDAAGAKHNDIHKSVQVFCDRYPQWAEMVFCSVNGCEYLFTNPSLSLLSSCYAYQTTLC